jgi:hypothetical protein
MTMPALCRIWAQTPVCGPEGVIYDILNIIPYIQKVRLAPVSG